MEHINLNLIKNFRICLRKAREKVETLKNILIPSRETENKKFKIDREKNIE